MQHGGRPPSWKIEKSLHLSKGSIDRYWWNLAQWRRFGLSYVPAVKKKSKMAAAAILENRKIVWPIMTKFDVVTRFGTPYARVDLKLQF